jgi:hypothetical protein
MQRCEDYFSTLTLCGLSPVSQNFHDRIIITDMVHTCVPTFPSYNAALMNAEHVKYANAESAFDGASFDLGKRLGSGGNIAELLVREPPLHQGSHMCKHAWISCNDIRVQLLQTTTDHVGGLQTLYHTRAINAQYLAQAGKKRVSLLPFHTPQHNLCRTVPYSQTILAQGTDAEHVDDVVLESAATDSERAAGRSTRDQYRKPIRVSASSQDILCGACSQVLLLGYRYDREVIHRANVRWFDTGPVEKTSVVTDILIGMTDKMSELPVLERHNILPPGTGMFPQFPESVEEFVSKQETRPRFLNENV